VDPVQFRIDWEVLSELLVTIIVLAFFIERALSLVVENKLFVRSKLDDIGIKEVLSFALSWVAVKIVGFDAMAVLFKMDAPTFLGYLITAAIIAGGSKASIKLFHDLMDVKSSAVRQKDAQKKPAHKVP
jgi:hypothetical protein